MSDPKIIYAVEGPINPRSGAPTLLPALGEPAEVKELRSRIAALETDYAEAIEIIRAFHSRVKIDGTSLRLGAPSPNSTMGRAAALLARASPQREGDSPASPNDGGSRHE